MLKLDHIAVSATALDQASIVEATLGVPLQHGGQHREMATHNRLLGLGDDYLEVIAPDPDAAPVSHPRWFDLDHFAGPPRLTTWICRVDDLSACLRLWPQAGRIMDFARGALRWQMAVPDTGKLPYDGAFPALIAWQSAHPAAQLKSQGCRLVSLEVRHPLADEMRALLSPYLADERIVFVSHPVKDLRAQIETPDGIRVLT